MPIGPTPGEDGYFYAIRDWIASNTFEASDVWGIGQALVNRYQQDVAAAISKPESQVAVSGLFLNGAYTKIAIMYCFLSEGRVLNKYHNTLPSSAAIYYYMFNTRAGFDA